MLLSVSTISDRPIFQISILMIRFKEGSAGQFWKMPSIISAISVFAVPNFDSNFLAGSLSVDFPCSSKNTLVPFHQMMEE